MFPAYPFPKKEFWIFFHYTGIRFIGSLIHPVKQSKVNDDSYRKPATFPLWFLGIYIACFGVASQRYENRIDIIENRANAIFTQLGTPIYKKALARIPRVQRLPCPVKPNIKNPLTVWKSLFSADTVYTEMVDQLKETVEIWKDSLNQVNLSEAILDSAFLRGAKLSGADLSYADLSWAVLWEADLSGANLYKADLREASLDGADLSGAWLIGANLREASLGGADLSWAALIRADLSGADLTGAVLGGAYLDGADLRDVYNLTIKKLSEVNTLYEAKLDSVLMEQVKKDHPHLLEEPKEEYGKFSYEN